MLHKIFSSDQSLGYITALDSPSIDSSDFILLSREVLKHKLGAKILPQLELIQNYYVHYKNEDAIKVILKVCEDAEEINNSPLHKKILKASTTCSGSDNQLLNQSRRYFETMLAKQSFTLLDKKDFESVTLWSKFKNKFLKRTDQACEIESLETLMTAIDIDYMNQATEEYLNEVLKFRDQVKINALKDRGPKRFSSSSEFFYSCNDGIMKSLAPNHCDNRSGIKTNRIVDIFKIDEKKNGFSTVNKSIPYVNSVSGTTFDVSVLLEKFVIEYASSVSQTDMEKHVNNIFHIYRLFACLSGFHSFGETGCVINSPEVLEVFAKYGISVNIYFQNEAIATAMTTAAEYARKLCLQKLVHMELASKVPVIM